MLSTTMWAIDSRSSATALPMWGVSTTLGIARSDGLDLGLALEDVEPRAGDAAFAQRAASAFSSTIGPRAVLTRNAERFINRSSRSPIR